LVKLVVKLVVTHTPSLLPRRGDDFPAEKLAEEAEPPVPPEEATEAAEAEVMEAAVVWKSGSRRRS